MTPSVFAIDDGIPISPADVGGRREVGTNIVEKAARDQRYLKPYAAAKAYFAEYCPKQSELTDKQYQDRLKFFAKKIKAARDE